jgi:hypothetical protein
MRNSYKILAGNLERKLGRPTDRRRMVLRWNTMNTLWATCLRMGPEVGPCGNFIGTSGHIGGEKFLDRMGN